MKNTVRIVISENGQDRNIFATDKTEIKFFVPVRFIDPDGVHKLGEDFYELDIEAGNLVCKFKARL